MKQFMLTAAALLLLSSAAHAGDITNLPRSAWKNYEPVAGVCEMRLGLPESTGTIHIRFEGARSTNIREYQYPPRVLVRLQKMDWSFGNPRIMHWVEMNFDGQPKHSGQAQIDRFGALEIPIATESGNVFINSLAEFDKFTVNFVAAPAGYALAVTSWSVATPGDSEVTQNFIQCAQRITGVTKDGKSNGRDCLVRRSDRTILQTSCENVKNSR